MIQLFPLFKRQKRGRTSTGLPAHQYSNISNSIWEVPAQPISHPDSKMARLIALIGGAVNEWAIEYHLENLPKRIIFAQALDAMRIIELTMDDEKYL